MQTWLLAAYWGVQATPGIHISKKERLHVTPWILLTEVEHEGIQHSRNSWHLTLHDKTPPLSWARKTREVLCPFPLLLELSSCHVPHVTRWVRITTECLPRAGLRCGSSKLYFFFLLFLFPWVGGSQPQLTLELPGGTLQIPVLKPTPRPIESILFWKLPRLFQEELGAIILDGHPSIQKLFVDHQLCARQCSPSASWSLHSGEDQK